MTKSELAAVVSHRTGLTTQEVKTIIDNVNRVIMDTNGSGEAVYMRGFGSFVPKVRKQKIGRNIQAGTPVIVPEHTIPTFKPAPGYKERMNHGK